MRTTRTVKTGTIEQRQLCEQFDYAHDHQLFSLSSVYKSWSDEKSKAMQEVRRIAAMCDGYGLVIVSHSGWKFTVAYLVDKTVGEGQLLTTISKDKVLICEYEGRHFKSFLE